MFMWECVHVCVYILLMMRKLNTHNNTIIIIIIIIIKVSAKQRKVLESMCFCLLHSSTAPSLHHAVSLHHPLSWSISIFWSITSILNHSSPLPSSIAFPTCIILAIYKLNFYHSFNTISLHLLGWITWIPSSSFLNVTQLAPIHTEHCRNMHPRNPQTHAHTHVSLI